MQIISIDDDGRVTIMYDSRWANPELLGYKPSDPQYKCLREMWRKIHRDDLEDEDSHIDHQAYEEQQV